MEKVEGKVAFITGAASGMGLGMAKVFSQAGMRVVVADIRREAIDRALGEFPQGNPGILGVQLDVADRAGYRRAADEAERAFGKIHVLVNNAGVGIVGSLLEATYDDWDWGLSVNLGGVINGIQTMLPRIRAHGEGGHVIATSSMSGIFAAALAGIYTTAKYAVVGLMESLRPELDALNIGCSVFCPGLVSTNIGEAESLRPAAFRDSSYGKGSAERAVFMREKIFPHGMSPIEVGERVLAGMKRNDLWILTHPEYRGGAQERFDAILESFPVEGPAPPERIQAEAMVIRNPLFPAERERQRARRKNAGA